MWIIWIAALIGILIGGAKSGHGADYSNTFAQWGIAADHPGTKDTSQIKWVEFGKSGEIGKKAYTIGLGGWSDSSKYKNTDNDPKTYNKSTLGQAIPDGAKALSHGGDTVQNSLFIEGLMGVEPKAKNFYMSYKLGPAIISTPDILLGSYIQVAHELVIGMKDERNVRMALVIKHFSDAGIIKPNVGRDLIGLRIEF